MTAQEMIFGFDVIAYICKNYRRVLASYAAIEFDLPMQTVEEIYSALGIVPLKVTYELIENPGKFDVKKVTKNLGEKRVRSILNDADWVKLKKFVTSPDCQPNRKSIKRPAAIYSNTSPYGIAKELHNKKDGE